MSDKIKQKSSLVEKIISRLKDSINIKKEMTFKNPSTGDIKKVSLWDCLWILLFGPFYFAVKGAWSLVMLFVFLLLITAGISWFLFPFLVHIYMRQNYLNKGWVEDEQPIIKQKNASESIMKNFEKYAEYTKEQNWKGICELNNVDLDSFGSQKELKVLSDHLEDDEVVFALTSGIMSQTKTSNAFDFGMNTWLVVLTNERFLFIDCAMLTSSVDTQSVRHDHVQAVSSSQGLVLGKVMVDLGSRLIVIDNCQKATVPVFVNLANKWHKELQKQKIAPARVAVPSEESHLDKLEKLANLYSTGALTEEEFKTAKSKILSTI